MTYQQIKKWMIPFLMLLILLEIIFIIQLNVVLLIINGVIIMLSFFYYLTINKIKETTLCFVVKEDYVLMMYRNKKQGDVHIHKYNGLGGRVEQGESHRQCVLREAFEEAGIILTDYHYVGKVTFKNFIGNIGKEVMYTYCAYQYENEITECNEGDLVWIKMDEVLDLPLWEGDKYFLMNIIKNQPFNAFLHYNENKVVDVEVKLKHESDRKKRV